ncbi:phenolic glucoside malonyltransferase 1-like [Andrographis paniculata]|uniref:phenolic glucoside malonyltransferase 1-like n=1 Tax=Andrographis paniculata TaxID=175694 RepID=UPI0021E93F52|nr:phenolic glucoside malonyltransferase 1-like [Andrographis paniculata]
MRPCVLAMSCVGAVPILFCTVHNSINFPRRYLQLPYPSLLHRKLFPMAGNAIERCNIQPSAEDLPTAELILPLTPLDLIWLYFHPAHRLLFYEIPSCTKSQFLQTIVPNLKQSLAQTLARFLPLTGKIVIPDDSGRMPFARFAPGDSVSFTVSESDKDFNHLVGNHSRNADEFYDCVPQLPPAEQSAGGIEFSVLAVQVTLFPGHGVCVGINNHHAIGDARCTVDFVKSWAAVNKSGEFNYSDPAPVLDRTGFKDPDDLGSIFWKMQIQYQGVKFPKLPFPLNKVRRTFVLTNDQIKKLKQYIVETRPCLTHVTSFTVTCGLVWTSLARAEPIADDEPEYMVFTADCRRRLNPPLPEAYFGNCLSMLLAETSHGSLKGEAGLATAAELLGEAIREIVDNKEGILADGKNWPEKYGGLTGKRVLAVAGSPKFSMYSADYGWGRPRKFETGAIDWERAVSVSAAMDSGGGLEIGLCLKKETMDAFADVFDRTVHKHSHGSLPLNRQKWGNTSSV